MFKKLIVILSMLVFAIAHGSNPNSIVLKGILPNGMIVHWACEPGVSGPVQILLALNKQEAIAFTLNCGTSI